MKAGTFDPYPSHSADPYKVKVPRSINIVNKSGKTFMPSQGPKSTPTVSIVNQNVLKYVFYNNENIKSLNYDKQFTCTLSTLVKTDSMAKHTGSKPVLGLNSPKP